MKTTLKSILTLALVMGLGIMANAQKTSSAPATATILANLTIALESGSDIAFGMLSASTPSIVTLDANGPTGTTGTTGNANTGSVTDVARFNLAGDNSAVTVKYDATVILSNGTPANDMTMTPEVVGAALVTGQGSAAAVLNDQLVTLVSGVYYLWVGGTIPQLSNQPMGDYAGTFKINVEYN